jgi:hypothetical protein
MPTNQAFHVFYGTLPLIVILVGNDLRRRMVLKDILDPAGRACRRHAKV